MIELHGAHGYLIAQFLSPFSNQRADRYGGSTENRTLFLREILAAVREAVGKECPLCCRISADEYVEDGITLDEAKNIARILAHSGADTISVSAGIGSDRFAPKKEDGRRCYAHLARGIREVIDVPVIGVGNILDMSDAEKILLDSDADLTAIGRSLIAEPRLVIKSASGKTGEINQCIRCGNCLRSVVQGPMTCSINGNL
jgi:2,4-dienoyl-CoA reductase-like NADH-dependent reductase (Old Yellow Enzyme family)